MGNKTTNTDIAQIWSEQIKKLRSSDEFLKLEECYNHSTIFDALGIQRTETKHSKFLQWLLNPKSNHQLSDVPLRLFLMLLSGKDKIDDRLKMKFLTDSYKINDVNIETERESYRLKNKNNPGRIDIFLSFKIDDKENIAIIIENKIYALETTVDISNDIEAKKYYEAKYGKAKVSTLEQVGQTLLYQFWAETKLKDAKKIYVYLTPDDDNLCESKDYNYVTYQEIVDYVIDPILSKDMNNDIRFFINEYLRTICKPSTDEYNEETIIATSKEEKKYLKKLGKEYGELIKKAFENKDKEENNLNRDEKLLKSFWEKHNKMLPLILKETDPETYEKIKNEKKKNSTHIKYNNIVFRHFSKFVWQVISDYVDNQKIIDIIKLQEKFEDKDSKGYTVQMFATEKEYIDYQKEQVTTCWTKKAITLFDGSEKIYVTNVWKKKTKQKNHSQERFINILKEDSNYRVEGDTITYIGAQ